MTQCTKCGFEISPNFKFCPQCATPVSEQHPPVEAPQYVPFGSGERELYRTEVKYGHIFILTTQQIILVANPRSWLDPDRGKVLDQHSLWEISTIRVEPGGFLSSPRVIMRLTSSIDPDEIECRNVEQAQDLAAKIRSAMPSH